MDEVIAIDGPAAAGKSTVAQRVADALGAPYVNTGNMYRAVAWAAMARGVGPDAAAADLASFLAGFRLEHRREADGALTLLADGRPVGPEIRSPEVAAQVSRFAALPSVREWLVERQRDCAALGRIVMEGRDIGTVIFPGARHKFFLTASPEVRARRRLAQDGETVAGATVATVAAEIARRDEMDSTRAHAPLRRADDAVLVDGSDLNVAQVVARIVGLVLAHRPEEVP